MSIKPYILFLLMLQLPLQGSAQDAVHNYGNIQMHDDALVGFHIDLTNDGSFDENKGLTGFYSDDLLTVSGAYKPIFHDMEIMTPNGLYLEVPVGVKNNNNFILGDVITPRNLSDINLDFISSSFYIGESNLTKVDGYAMGSLKQNFVFPIGYDQKLRPLEISSEDIDPIAKCAYFFEDPNSPLTFATNFNTDDRVDILTNVSSYEFWDLDASALSTVSLTWDTDSSLANFVDDLDNLRIVGWNTTYAIWEDLGATAISGDFNSGRITSDKFVPDNYSVLTFGSSLSAGNISLDNYLMSPNGDGFNDVLFIEAVAVSPHNQLQIFNRWGKMVYHENDYKNQFSGRANVKFVTKQNSNLPSGVYFYLIHLYDIDIVHQGFLYLNN